jgi:hypothetical protein
MITLYVGVSLDHTISHLLDYHLLTYFKLVLSPNLSVLNTQIDMWVKCDYSTSTSTMSYSSSAPITKISHLNYKTKNGHTQVRGWSTPSDTSQTYL